MLLPGGFTFESQLIIFSVLVLILGTLWCAWRCLFERNGSTYGEMFPAKSTWGTVIFVLLAVVVFTNNSEVRQMVPPGAFALTLVLGAATLLPFFFTSLVFRQASSNAELRMPDAAATALLIKQRRSVFPKDYNGASVPRIVIERALEAANWAPTHGKTEPWRFVVFSGQPRIQELEDLKLKATEATMAEQPEKLQKTLDKMARKRKDVAKVSHIIALIVKRVENLKGELMPAWEETAAVACAVQNFHLSLTAQGYAGYWSSGGVNGWADTPEVRAKLGADGEVKGESDRVIGWFYVGATDKMDAYKGRRGPIDKKVTWLE